MTTDVIIYPCIGKEDGDKIYGEPLIFKGYVVPKYNVVITRSGEEMHVNSAIYLDGIYVDEIHDSDEIETAYLGRLPIKTIIPYTGINDKCELLEVMV